MPAVNNIFCYSLTSNSFITNYGRRHFLIYSPTVMFRGTPCKYKKGRNYSFSENILVLSLKLWYLKGLISGPLTPILCNIFRFRRTRTNKCVNPEQVAPRWKEKVWVISCGKRVEHPARHEPPRIPRPWEPLQYITVLPLSSKRYSTTEKNEPGRFFTYF